MDQEVPAASPLARQVSPTPTKELVFPSLTLSHSRAHTHPPSLSLHLSLSHTLTLRSNRGGIRDPVLYPTR